MNNLENYLVGNDDSIIALKKTTDEKINRDYNITTDLGLVVSTKSFVSKHGVFFEEYSNKVFS